MTFPPLTDGIGRYLPKGADVVLEIHYHQTYKTTSDRTKVALYFQPHVQQYVKTAAIVNRTIRVPAGRAGYRATAEGVRTGGIVAIRGSPHMPRPGTAVRIKASAPG